MLHRLPTDCIALASLSTAAFSSTLAFTEVEWQRVLGPLGGYVLSLLMLLYFIGRDRSQTKERKTEAVRSEAAREERHKEIVSLTVKAITAQNEMASSVQTLTDELSKRTCWAKKSPTTSHIN